MIQAWFYLVYAIFLTKTRSLEQLKPILTKRKSTCKEAWSIQEVEQVSVLIERSKHFLFSRAACLEQSLALFFLATSKGKSVDWCVGVKLAPFASHAWIEVNGVPIREPETVDTYQKILVI